MVYVVSDPVQCVLRFPEISMSEVVGVYWCFLWLYLACVLRVSLCVVCSGCVCLCVVVSMLGDVCVMSCVVYLIGVVVTCVM